MHIQVNDVNEFAPVFRETEYRASVTEGKIYDNILQVEATDQDCSPQYSQICNYQITTARTPFAIDRNGEWASAAGRVSSASFCLFGIRKVASQSNRATTLTRISLKMLERQRSSTPPH